MHLTEVLIAAALLATVLTGLPPAFAGAVRANLAAANTTWSVVLAAQKMEEIRSVPFTGSVIESFDLLDERGRAIEGPGSPPAYLRTWRTELLPSALNETLVITVVVTPYRPSSAGGSDRAIPGATRLVTLRTRKSA